MQRKRALVLPALFAIGAHAWLLVALGGANLPAWDTAAPIRISFLPPSGPGPEPAGDGKPASAPTSQQQTTIVAAPVAPRQRPARIPHASRMLRQRSPLPAAVEPVAAPAAADGDGASGGAVAVAAGAPGGGGEGMGGGKGSGGGDQRPFCESCPEPDYPLIARRRGWNGSVDVELILLADGKVDSAQIARSSGHDSLDNEAIVAARRSRFRLPPMQHTPLRGRIEYRFELVSAR